MQSWRLRFDHLTERVKLLLQQPSWRIYVLLVVGMLVSLISEGVWGVVIGVMFLAWAVVGAARLHLPAHDSELSPVHR